jgi:hypothetical protein
MSNWRIHLWYLALIASGLIFIHAWMHEHDACVAAEQSIKQSNAQIATLQSQITSINNKTSSDVDNVKRIVTNVKTPQQLVASAPSLTDVPLGVRAIPGDPVDVEVAALPLAQVLATLKTSQIELGGCQQTSAIKDQQIEQYKTQVAALKKKPKFLKRLEHGAEEIGIAVAAGFILAKVH